MHEAVRSSATGALLLGPVVLVHDGHEVEVRGPIPRLLLARLVLASGAVVTDDAFVRGVWGDEPPDTAEAALRVHLSKVRAAVRAVGADVVRASGGYVLRPPLPALDVDELDDLERIAHAGPGDDAVGACERAARLWRGPALSDVRRLPYGALAAIDLDRRQRAVDDRRAELLVQAGRGREALAALERHVAEDPLHEGAWVNLAAALYQDGRPADALRALEQARRHLGHTSGLDPSARLVDLERRILDNDRALLGTAPAPPVWRLPPTLVARLPRRLVERDGELAMVADAVARAQASGTGAVLRLVGPAGSGKTALAAVAAERAVATGTRVVHAWCEVHGETALRPLHPVIGKGPTTDAPGADDEQRSQRIAAAQRQVVELARDRPTLLVLDDLQWADELTALVVQGLARHPVPTPLVVLVTERDGGVPVVPLDRLTSVPVPPLSADGVADLLGLAPHEGADAFDVAEIAARTAGLPALVEAAAQSVRRGQPWARAVGESILAGRTVGMSRAAQHTLTVASAIGSTFSFAQLERATDQHVLALLDHLEAGLTAGLIRVHELASESYRFTHDLVPDALLDLLALSHRARLFAHVSASVGDGLDPHRRLRLLLSAGALADGDALADAALTALDDLVQCSAFSTARARADEVLADARVTGAARARLLVCRARAAAALHDAAGAHGDLADAADLAREAGDMVVLARAVYARSQLGHRFVASGREADELRRLVDRLPPGAAQERFDLRRLMAFAHLNAGDAASATRTIERALADAGSTVAVHDIISLEHWLYDAIGDGERRRAVVARAEALARDGEPGTELPALGLGLIEALHAGRRADAEGLAAAVVEAATRQGVVHAAWLGRAAGFTVPFLEGDTERAAAASNAALRAGRRDGVLGAFGAWATQQFVLTWVHGGDLGAFVDQLRGVAVEGSRLPWDGGLALALAASGQGPAARDVLSSVIGEVATCATHWLGLAGLAAGVEGAAQCGHHEFLAAAEAPLRQRQRDHIVLGWGAVDYGPATRYLALALAGTGRADEGAALLAAVAADEGAGPVWRARAAQTLTTLEGERTP